MFGRLDSARVVTIAIVALVAHGVAAQETALQVDLWLEGRVVDERGEPAFGVRIEVVVDGEEDAEPIVAHTDEEGRYRLFLRNGTLRYRLSISARGHQTRTRLLKPLVLPYVPPVPGITRILQQDFVLFSEDAVIERARADLGRGRASPEEVRFAATTLHNRGIVAARFNDLAQAEALIREAIEMAPDFWPARASLAKILHDQGEMDAFLEAAAEARAAGEEDPEVALLVCAFLELDGREDEVGPVLESLRRSDPATAVRCLHRLAIGAANLRFDERAYGHLEEALELDPRHVESLYLAGVVAHRLGDRGAAISHLEALLALEPGGERTGAARDLLAELGDEGERATP